jgi:Tol biopolymer transport system component
VSAWFLLRPRYDYVWNARAALPESVNCPGVEACEPNFTPDGGALVFTRGSAGKGTDLWIVPVRPDGTPSDAPVPLRDVNTEFDEIDGMLGTDDVLYFYSDRPGGLGGYDLHAATRRKDGTFEPAANLGPNVNSEYNDYDPCLSPDGKFLYFASNRHSAGSEEDYDLYVCLRTDQGWSPPRALGGVNTAANEWEPMLAGSGRTLYFTSNRPAAASNAVARAGYDLHAATLVKDQGWGNVANLGTEVNSEQDEFDPAVHPRNDALLFVRGTRDGDAYEVRIWTAAQRAVPLGAILRLDRFPRAAILAIAALVATFALLWALIVGWQRLSVLQKCLLASLAAHCLAAWILTMVAMKSHFEELQRSDSAFSVYTDLPEDVAQDVLLGALFRDETKVTVSKAPQPTLPTLSEPESVRLEPQSAPTPMPAPSREAANPLPELPMTALTDAAPTPEQVTRPVEDPAPMPERHAPQPSVEWTDMAAPTFEAPAPSRAEAAPTVSSPARRDAAAPPEPLELRFAAAPPPEAATPPSEPAAPAPSALPAPSAGESVPTAPTFKVALAAPSDAVPDVHTPVRRTPLAGTQVAPVQFRIGAAEERNVGASDSTVATVLSAPSPEAPPAPARFAVPATALGSGPTVHAPVFVAKSPPSPALAAPTVRSAMPSPVTRPAALDWTPRGSERVVADTAASAASPTHGRSPSTASGSDDSPPLPPRRAAPTTVGDAAMASALGPAPYRPPALLPGPSPTLGVSRRLAARERVSRIEWGRPENLGPGINRGGETYEPNLSADGKTLWFTHGPAGGEANLLRSERSGNGWTAPTPLKTLNSEFDDIDATLDGTGRTVVFYSNRPGGLGGYDLFASVLDDNGEWMAPTNLGTRVNSEWNDYDPHVSRDGKRLFFSSNRQSQGSEEDYDLYSCEWSDVDACWRAPVRLAISTLANDWEPALSPDGLSLYFCSNRPGGKGGYDLWVSHHRDGQWQAPVPLDGAVNTESDELDPAVSPDGESLFFVSNRKGAHGTFDIWQAKRRLME